MMNSILKMQRFSNVDIFIWNVFQGCHSDKAVVKYNLYKAG